MEGRHWPRSGRGGQRGRRDSYVVARYPRAQRRAELVTARLDAVKVALSIAVGSGGLFALYLAWRRQRSTEADLDNRERALAHQLQVAADTKAHQERVALNTEADAQARRITDLFTKAVEQLGSEKAPVRLGALYALRRLGQENPPQRQTVVDVICAYLRMPYVLAQDMDTNAEDKDIKEATLELQVRLAAQGILQEHLRYKSTRVVDSNDGNGFAVSPIFWADIDLNLRDATLVGLELAFCQFRRAIFDRATFYQETAFILAEIEYASFQGARFLGTRAIFNGARFAAANFTSATFDSVAAFNEATFAHLATFDWAKFLRTSSFSGVTLPDLASFKETRFEKGVPAEVQVYHLPPTP